MRAGVFVVAAAVLALAFARQADVEWPMHGGVDNIRYLSLIHI